MFARLAVAMRVKDADAIQMGVYYEALGGYSLVRVRDAALHWSQTGRFFPTTGEWCSLVEEMREAVPQPVWLPKLEVLCETCQDTGWDYRDCQAGQRCGTPGHLQKGAEFTHVYVVRCACFTADPR